MAIPGCDSSPIPAITDPACNLVGGITDAVDFATDPLGYLVAQLAKGVTGLAESIFPTLTALTQPDLSVSWFKTAYSISWGLSFFMLVFVLGMNFFQMGRGKIGTEDVVETLAIYLPAWALGCAVGPLLGVMAINLVSALTKGIWQVPGFGAGKQMVESGKFLAELADSAGKPDFPGGSIVAIVLLFLMIVALLAVLVVLIIMMLTLYFAGALFPLVLVWILKPRSRAKGLKIVYLWVGILGSQVLLFFLLSVAFSMFAKSSDFLTGKVADPIQSLVGVAAGIVAIVFAAISPFWAVSKFGGVGPDAGSSDIDAPSRSGGSTQIGPQSATNSQAAQLSTQTAPVPAGAGNGRGEGAQRLYDSGSSGSAGAPGSKGAGGGQSGGAATGSSPMSAKLSGAGGAKGAGAGAGAAGVGGGAAAGGGAAGGGAAAGGKAHPAAAAAVIGAKTAKAGASWTARTAAQAAAHERRSDDGGDA